MAKLTASAEVSTLLAAANYSDFLFLLGLAPANTGPVSDTLVLRGNSAEMEAVSVIASTVNSLEYIFNPGSLGDLATIVGNMGYAQDLTAPSIGAVAADGGSDAGIVAYNGADWIVVAVL